VLYLENVNDFKYFGKEHVLVIMNHKYDIDWLLTWIVCERLGMIAVCHSASAFVSVLEINAKMYCLLIQSSYLTGYKGICQEQFTLRPIVGLGMDICRDHFLKARL
jgi:hypothetical protein